MYNTLGQLTRKIDPEVLVWNEATGTSGLESPTTNYHYNAHNDVVAVTNARGYTNTQRVENGVVLQEFDAAGGVKDKGYNIFGDVIAETRTYQAGAGANRLWTRYQYDAKGQLTQIERPDTAVESFTYDELGHRISHTKQYDIISQADTTQATESYRYDARGRITSYTSFAGLTTRYSYQYLNSMSSGLAGIPNDGLGQSMVDRTVSGWEVTTTRADGKTLIDRQDSWGRNHYHKDLGDHQFYYQYNQAGWLTGQKGDTADETGLAQNIEYVYYNNGLLKQVSDLSSNRITYYEYDNNGNQTLEGITDIAGTVIATETEYYQLTRAEYDALNRVTKLTDPRYETSYLYDANGNRINIHTDYDYFFDTIVAQNTVLSETQDYWYAYDALDRFTTTMGTLEGGQVVRGTTGYDISYYADSNRRTSIRSYAHDAPLLAGQEVKETYAYTNSGYLAQTIIEGRETGTQDSFSQLNRINRTVNLAGQTRVLTERDASGSIITETETTYNFDNLKLRQDKTWIAGQQTDSHVLYSYFANSNELEQVNDNFYRAQVANPIQLTETISRYRYEYWDTAKQQSITKQQRFNEPTGTQEDTDIGTSRFSYDANGHLVRVRDTEGDRFIQYAVDQQGKVLARNQYEDDAFQAVQSSHNYYYFAGRSVGDVGDDNAVARDYAQILAARQQSQTGNTLRPVTSADFDQNFQPIGPDYPGNAPGSYTVAYDGQTLQQIASDIWGDSSLWYLIADANGLTAERVLLANTVLTIPNVVTNIHNNSTVFKPYSPGQAIGNVQPTVPEAPAPRLYNALSSKELVARDIRALENLQRAALLDANGEKYLEDLRIHYSSFRDDGCGVADIIVVAIAIAVTVYTAGALGGPALGAVAAGQATAGTLAIAGAAGAAAGQLAGNVLGTRSGFDLGEIAMAGATAYITAGISPAFQVSAATYSQTGAAVINAGIANVASQTLNIAVGQQNGFSWRSLAAAGIAGGINHHVDESFGQNASRTLDNGRQNVNYDPVKGATKAVTNNLVSQGAGILVRSQNSINWESVASSGIQSIAEDYFEGQFDEPGVRFARQYQKNQLIKQEREAAIENGNKLLGLNSAETPNSIKSAKELTQRAKEVAVRINDPAQRAELVERFGSEEAFDDYVNAYKAALTAEDVYLNYSSTSSEEMAKVILMKEALGAFGIERVVNPSINQAVFSGPSGFYGALYHDRTAESYSVIFRGTEGTQVNDLLTNLANGVGLPTAQYQQAIKLAQAVQEHPIYGQNLSVGGHSLGGGLATIAAAATGLNLTTFNAAGVSQSAAESLSVNLNNIGENSSAYYLTGDILSNAQDSTLVDVVAAVALTPVTIVFDAIQGLMPSVADMSAASGNRIAMRGYDQEGEVITSSLTAHSQRSVLSTFYHQFMSP